MKRESTKSAKSSRSMLYQRTFNVSLLFILCILTLTLSGYLKKRKKALLPMPLPTHLSIPMTPWQLTCSTKLDRARRARNVDTTITKEKRRRSVELEKLKRKGGKLRKLLQRVVADLRGHRRHGRDAETVMRAMERREDEMLTNGVMLLHDIEENTVLKTDTTAAAIAEMRVVSVIPEIGTRDIMMTTDLIPRGTERGIEKLYNGSSD